MNDVQFGMLGLLREIDDICSRNGIAYYLGGGTALGAIRHKGFLPWDDDADLYITRDNWEKLLSVADEELSKDRELVCIERFSDYRNPIARYMDLGSTWIYQSQMFSGVPSGQHVEFLILDPMPKDEALHREYCELFQVYNELLGSYFVVNRVVSRKQGLFNYELYSYWKEKMEKDGRDVVLSELEEHLFCFPEEDCSLYHLRHGFEFHVYTKSNFGKQRYVPFETESLPVAEFAEAVFREAYGDSWKKIPDANNQVTHSSISNLTVPYSEYWKRSFSLVDREEARETQIQWKELAVDLIPLKNQVADDYGQMKSVLDGALMEYLYKEDTGSFGLSDYESYYRLQTGLDARRNELVFDVDPSFVRSAFKCWLARGEYWRPYSLLCYEWFSRQYNSLYDEYYGACKASREIDRCLDLGDTEGAMKLSRQCDRGLEEVSPLPAHAERASMIEEKRLPLELMQKVGELRLRFPEYSYFSYCEALLAEETDLSKAIVLYKTIIDSSLDGLVVLDSKARLGSLGVE